MRRNLILSFVQRHLQLLVSVASVIVLSRLITPEETGIFSIGVAIAALTHAVRDFGVGNFLVKENDITHPKIQTAFTVSLLIAGVLSVVLLGASYPVAAFYHKPEVGSVILITTVGLLISPLSTIALALLLRQQRFADMFKVSMASSFANAGLSVLFGWLGFGAKALALGQLGMSLTLVVGANLVIRDWSIYRLSLAHWREISNFGLHMTVSGVSEQMGGRANDLMVGKLVSFSAVGLLSRSGTLVAMVQDSVQSAVMPVVLTTMASDLRKTGNAAPLLLRSLSYFSALMWPVYAVISLYAHDAIAVLFGAKWIDAAPYTSVLCWGASLAVLSSLVSTTCNATNQAHLLSRYSAATQAMRVVLIAIGAFSGSLGVIVRLLVVAEALQCVLAYVYIRRATAIHLRDVVHHCWRSLLAAVLVVAAVMPLQALDCLPALRLAIVFFASAFAWVAAMFIVRHPMANEITNALGFVLLRMRALRTR